MLSIKRLNVVSSFRVGVSAKLIRLLAESAACWFGALFKVVGPIMASACCIRPSLISGFRANRAIAGEGFWRSPCITRREISGMALVLDSAVNPGGGSLNKVFKIVDAPSTMFLSPCPCFANFWWADACSVERVPATATESPT